MLNDSSASLRAETPHLTNPSKTTISNALKRRAQSVINDRSIDSQTRALVRYGLEINDPSLAELVCRVDAGESIETLDLSHTPDTNEDASRDKKIEALTAIICRAGDEPETKSAALLVLMATLENAPHPKALATRQSIRPSLAAVS